MLYLSRLNGFNSGRANFCTEANSLFARMTTPPTFDRKVRMNRLIVNLKGAGVWSSFDWLYVFAAADTQAALLNWVGSDSATNGGVGFNADRGYVGDGTHTITGLSSAPSSVTHVGAWCNNISAGGGKLAQSDSGTWVNPFTSGGKVQGTTENASPMTSVASGATGHVMAMRFSDVDQRLYLNGSQVATSAAAAGSVGAVASTFLSGATGNRLAVAHAGRTSFTTTQTTALYNAFNEYLSGIGAA